MASAKGRIVRLISKIALERATVLSVKRIGGFQRVQFQCNMRSHFAGTKVQLLLPSSDMRTYTPIRSPNGMTLLGWSHAGGPGANWMLNARIGEQLPFVGPQRSLQLKPEPIIIVGDETSVAVAATFALERVRDVRVIIQSDAPSDVHEVAASIGLRGITVIPSGQTGSTVEAIVSQFSILPDAVVVLTGGSDLVLNIRHALREEGIKNIKTKTYWVSGKTGLD